MGLEPKLRGTLGSRCGHVYPGRTRSRHSTITPILPWILPQNLTAVSDCLYTSVRPTGDPHDNRQHDRRYTSYCSSTGAKINPGDAIEYNRRTKKAILRARGQTIIVGEHDDSKYISNYFRSGSGAEVYRNKRGLCVDAPCCGCCNG